MQMNDDDMFLWNSAVADNRRPFLSSHLSLVSAVKQTGTALFKSPGCGVQLSVSSATPCSLSATSLVMFRGPLTWKSCMLQEMWTCYSNVVLRHCNWFIGGDTEIHTWHGEQLLGHERALADPQWHERRSHLKANQPGTWAPHAQRHSLAARKRLWQR